MLQRCNTNPKIYKNKKGTLVRPFFSVANEGELSNQITHDMIEFDYVTKGVCG
jgi:hypothetical protein